MIGTSGRPTPNSRALPSKVKDATIRAKGKRVGPDRRRALTCQYPEKRVVEWADAQNARVHARSGPTVTVLAPRAAGPPHLLQSAVIGARPSANSMLKIAPAGGASSGRPAVCWATSVQVPAICSPARALRSMLEGPIGSEQADEVNEANKVKTTTVNDEN